MLRRIGIVMTALSSMAGIVVLLPMLLMMFSSFRADSEVGTMMYGLQFLYFAVMLWPFSVLGVALWTVGIYKGSNGHSSSVFEKGLNFFFIIILVLSFLLFLRLN